MKINLNCMRRVLLSVEEFQRVSTQRMLTPLSSEDLVEVLRHEKFTEEDIFYSTKQLIDSFYLDGSNFLDNHKQTYVVHDITPSGHEFLEYIRDPALWLEIKRVCQLVGNSALTTVYVVAESLVQKQTSQFLANYNPYL